MKKRFLLIPSVLLLLFTALCAAAAFAQTPMTHWVLEDGENRNPQTYYDEKPPVLETSGQIFTQGSKSLHFVTGTGYGTGYITCSQWPKAQDLSPIAENGEIRFDLYVKNPQDIRDANAGNLFEFRIGNACTEGYSVWYVNSALLKADTWNHIVLRLYGGKAILVGSSVNGISLNDDKVSSVDTSNVDWSHVTYSRLALYCAGKPVEGYLDNMTADTVSGSIPLSGQVLTLSQTDPDSHLAEAKQMAKQSVYYPKYEIIPPDIKPSAFFPESDNLLKWETASGWTARFENCKNPVFALAMDQAIRGKKNAKIEMQVTSLDTRVTLTPPTPIKIDHDFDTLEFWVYGNYGSKDIEYTFRQPNGNIFRWTGGGRPYTGTGQLFHSWSIGHVVLPKKLMAGTELVSIAVLPHNLGDCRVYLDEMRAIDYKKTLAKTPAPKYEHIGEPVKLPLSPNGACPKSAESVKTSIQMKNGTGSLTYLSPREEEVTYTYTPKTGTLSDLSIRINGKSSFLPADGAGPTFSFSGKTYTAGKEGTTAKCLSSKADKDSLEYTWKYTTPGGSSLITYQFSLNGKTLQVQVSSKDGSVSSFGLGNASGLNNPKVVRIPFMMRAPGVLCNDGYFTTFIVDWYKTNFSELSFDCGYNVKGDKAYYTYEDPGIIYLPKTNGRRWPLKDTLYITTSSTFEDCLPNISNPASPFKSVLKERQYRLISPVDLERPNSGAGWVKSAYAMTDLYDTYGMDNLYMMFHGGIWSNCAARGPEPFHSRLHASVATEGGDTGLINLFKYIREKGMYPGFYGGCNFWQPHSVTWDYNNTSLKSNGNWEPTWVQAYHLKPWNFPEITNTFYKEVVAKFGGMCVYEDGWTAGDLWQHNDYDARMTKSGRFPDTLQAVATGYRNERNSVGGPIFSEGDGSCFYTAGLNDGDYGKLYGYANQKIADVRKPVLLVDFELRKVAPLQAPVGLDLGYWRYCGEDNLDGGDHRFLHQYLATQIGFGTIGILEPYARMYDNPEHSFDSVLTSYFMMQQIQKRYVMETVDNIRYFNGTKLVDTSDALRSDCYLDNMLRIEYKNGLVIYINCNWDKKNWTIEEGGKKYILPSGGWFARQGNDFVEYTAQVDGRRVDFVDSPAYTYLNANGKVITLNGQTTDKIMIHYKEGKLKGKTLTYPK